jgi:hypothetical protein
MALTVSGTFYYSFLQARAQVQGKANTVGTKTFSYRNEASVNVSSSLRDAVRLLRPKGLPRIWPYGRQVGRIKSEQLS